MKKSLAFCALTALVAFFAVSCASTAPAKVEDKAAPKAEAKAPVDGPIVLKASKATITVGGGEGIRVEDGGNIGYWSSTDDIVAWTFDAAEGEYTVTVEYAVDQSFANAKATVTVGDTVLDWAVASTGTWGDYKKLDLGAVKLSAGSNTLKMQATAIADRFVANVKSVTLTKK